MPKTVRNNIPQAKIPEMNVESSGDEYDENKPLQIDSQGYRKSFLYKDIQTNTLGASEPLETIHHESARESKVPASTLGSSEAFDPNILKTVKT